MKVSVILTTYNSAQNLSKSLPSIFAQEGLGTAFEMEVIAIDNCSTDNTVEVLQSYGVNVLVNETNSGGPNKGRNRGLALATGDAICFIDDDDEWHPSKTLKQLQALEQAPIVTCSYVTIENETGKRLVRGQEGGGVSVYEANKTFMKVLTREKIGQISYMSTIMISAALKDVKFEEFFGKHDFDWLLRLYDGQTSAQVNIPLATRYVHSRNLSRTAAFRIVDYHFALLTLESYDEKYPKQCQLCMGRLNATRAKYHYEMGQMKDARRYFAKSQWEIKNALYYATTFTGNDWVRKHYMVFG